MEGVGKGGGWGRKGWGGGGEHPVHILCGCVRCGFLMGGWS